MGMGQYIQNRAMDFDSMVQRQAANRAENERAKAIASIKQGMIRDEGGKSYDATYQGMAGKYPAEMRTNEATSDAYYDVAASRYVDEYGPGPLESLNESMANNAAARYGVIGTAAVGGGLGLTAGAQKILGLMGILEEANQTEVARDQPLQS